MQVPGVLVNMTQPRSRCALPSAGAFVHTEGCLVVADGGFLPTDEAHLYDVKTCGDIIPFEQVKPAGHAAAQEAAFGAIHSSHGSAAFRRRCAFYPAGHEGVTITAHDVYLAAATIAEILHEYLVAQRAQVRGGHILTIGA